MMNPKYRGSRAFTHKWAGMTLSQDGHEPEQTGYDKSDLLSFGRLSVSLPDDFEAHPRLTKMHIANRLKSIDNNKIDWATAEAMALASLNMEGFNTRIIGEDSERGTFS